MGLLREVGPQGGGMKARPPPVLRTVGGRAGNSLRTSG